MTTTTEANEAEDDLPARTFYCLTKGCGGAFGLVLKVLDEVEASHACSRCGKPARSYAVPRTEGSGLTIPRLEPIEDYVALTREEAPTMSGTLFLPAQHTDAPQRGKIIAVGPGAWQDGERLPMQVAVDDIVVFGKYAGQESVIDGEEVLFMRERELMAILR